MLPFSTVRLWKGSISTCLWKVILMGQGKYCSDKIQWNGGKRKKKLRIKSSLWSYSCPQCVHNRVCHPTDLCCQWSSSCVSEGLCNGTGLPFPFCHHFSIWWLGPYGANLPVLLATAFWENIWLASELLRYKMAVQKWQFKYIKGFCFVLFLYLLCLLQRQAFKSRTGEGCFCSCIFPSTQQETDRIRTPCTTKKTWRNHR